MPPGKRVSENGNVYYESRPNRSDEDRRKKFDAGGQVSAQEITDIHNKAYQEFKAKFGERWAKRYFTNVDRLFPPFSSNIVEYRANGVVVKEGGKYILKPLADMDMRVWRIVTAWKPLDVSDQFVDK